MACSQGTDYYNPTKKGLNTHAGPFPGKCTHNGSRKCTCNGSGGKGVLDLGADSTPEDAQGGSTHHIRKNDNSAPKYYQCGSTGHLATGCPHKANRCNNCNNLAIWLV